MPSNVVKTDRDERLWTKAKGIVRKEYGISEGSDRFYKLVMGIYKRMKGEKSMYASYPILEKARVRAYQRRSKTGGVVSVREHETSRQAAQRAKKKPGGPSEKKPGGYDEKKMSKLIEKDQFLKFTFNGLYKKLGDQSKVLRIIYNTFVLGNSVMERQYAGQGGGESKAGKGIASDYPVLEKARIKAHQRRTKTGRIVMVREHEAHRQAVGKRGSYDEKRIRRKEDGKRTYQIAVSFTGKDSKGHYSKQVPEMTAEFMRKLKKKGWTPENPSYPERAFESILRSEISSLSSKARFPTNKKIILKIKQGEPYPFSKHLTLV